MKKIIKEYKSKTIEELEKEKEILSKEIAKLKIIMKINPPKDTNLLIKKRKQLAILLTVLSEKKLLEDFKK
ncbi:MAG: 50S ribosomal protein L29 [Patescibacteria group bacterium]|nr:50S ribosomal protein L29 [Patescibacteria group bacterium]